MQKAQPVPGNDVDYGNEYEHENYEKQNLYPHVQAREYYIALFHVASAFFTLHGNPFSLTNHPPLNNFTAISMINTIITTIANTGSP